jgi:flagellar hook-associated protein 2
MSSVSAVNTLLNGTATTTPAINISSILAAETGATTPGIDVTSAVAAAIYADRAPERIWQADQTTLTSQTTELTAMQTATEAITTDMQALNTLTGPLAARTVTSSNSNVTATAATGTVSDDHTVVVNTLAATGAWYSDLASSPTIALPASFITLTPATGKPITIATGTGNAGDNLNDLATAINAADANVTATVVSDSTGSRLAVISTTSGVASDFSMSASYTSWTAPEVPSGDTLGANSITLTSATTPATTATVTTTSGETYAQLATAINAVTPSLGVTATAGTDATTGGATLSILSNSSTPFTINETSTNSGFGFTQAVAGADASLTVDGVPIDSASNTVTGAIPGVTLTLLGTTSGSAADLTVASDATQVSTAINQFVADYNTAIGLVNTQYTFSAATGTEGDLASDPTVATLQSTLQEALNYVATPPTGTTTTVSTLSDLGITAGTDGTLTVDSATLDNALTNNPADVQNFFEGASLNGFAASVGNSLNILTDAAGGAFTVDLKSTSASNTALTSEINNFESGYIANQQSLLTTDFSSAEIALQQLPQEMQQLNAELGNSPSGSNS